MAMRCWRDMNETKDPKAKKEFLELGLRYAVTDQARVMLRKAMDGESQDDEYRSYPAEVTYLKLTPEDLGFRPVPVPGSLATASRADVLNSSSAVQEGVFGLFRPAANEQWAALPAWQPLALANQPAGLLVEDCSEVPALLFTAVSTPGLVFRVLVS